MHGRPLRAHLATAPASLRFWVGIGENGVWVKDS